MKDSSEKDKLILKKKNYRPDIDGLRALAVMSVVLYHAFPGRLPGGFVGVDVFFVISGFLITQIVFDDLEIGSFSIKQFFIKRARRIFPALILVLFSCAFFGWIALTAEELNKLGLHILAGVAFVSNLVFWLEVGYFDVSAEYKPLLHLWSLSVEEQFYLLWPLLLSLLFFTKIRIVWVIFVLLVVSFILNIILTYTYPTAAFFLPLPAPGSFFWGLHWLGG